MTSYKVVKDLKKRLSDNLRRRTLKTKLSQHSLTTDTKTTSFKIERKEAVLTAGNISNNSYMCLSVFIHSKFRGFGDDPLNLEAFKNPW